jgi:tartrate dehydrogenase/decarboxylase/D-malate dehydrogenase
MMLDELGLAQAAQAILDAVAATCATGPTTPDIGGSASTAEVGSAIAEHVRSS